MPDGTTLKVRFKFKESKKDRVKLYKKEQKRLRKAEIRAVKKEAGKSGVLGGGVPLAKPKPNRRALAASPVGVDVAPVYLPPPDLIDQVGIYRHARMIL